MKLAGVVRSKHDEPIEDQWQVMDEKERVSLIEDENGFMEAIHFFDHILLDIMTSCVNAFRIRLLVGHQ